MFGSFWWALPQCSPIVPKWDLFVVVMYLLSCMSIIIMLQMTTQLVHVFFLLQWLCPWNRVFLGKRKWYMNIHIKHQHSTSAMYNQQLIITKYAQAVHYSLTINTVYCQCSNLYSRNRLYLQYSILQQKF